MTGLPIKQPNWVQPRGGCIDSPSVFIALIGSERFERIAIILPDFCSKEIAWVCTHKHGVAIVVINIGSIGRDTHSEHRDSGG